MARWNKTDLSGMRFGRYTVLHIDESRAAVKTHYVCLCECGNTKSVCGTNLTAGSIKSCGCHRSRKRVPDLTCMACARSFHAPLYRHETARTCSKECAYANRKQWRSENADKVFWDRVNRRGPDECWPWLGGLRDDGYGVCDRNVGAHRTALELSTGAVLSPRDYVLHSCDNPACCNPRHLRVGDPVANGMDMRERNRASRGKKLSFDDVLRMRAMKTSGASVHEIAALFNVFPGYAKQVCAGRARKTA